MSIDSVTASPHSASARVCSIPTALFPSAPDGPLILRTADPAEPAAVLGPEVRERVRYLQLTDLTPSMAPLVGWGEGLAIDLLMSDPVTELPLLYRCTGLIDRHPVRVTVPLLAGVARAVKLAVSLGFPVRLSGHQPAPAVIEEAAQVLQAYLHDPTVSQPVEPFHGLLLSLLHGSPLSLWSLLERDPEQIRVLDERGTELSDQAPASVAAFGEGLLAAGAECRGCEWFGVCGGYFKWPQADYACDGVKPLLAEVRAAAAELQRDLAARDAPSRGSSDGI